jgi:hypothetical protein
VECDAAYRRPAAQQCRPHHAAGRPHPTLLNEFDWSADAGPAILLHRHGHGSGRAYEAPGAQHLSGDVDVPLAQTPLHVAADCHGAAIKPFSSRLSRSPVPRLAQSSGRPSSFSLLVTSAGTGSHGASETSNLHAQSG